MLRQTISIALIIQQKRSSVTLAWLFKSELRKIPIATILSSGCLLVMVWYRMVVSAWCLMSIANVKSFTNWHQLNQLFVTLQKRIETHILLLYLPVADKYGKLWNKQNVFPLQILKSSKLKIIDTNLQMLNLKRAQQQQQSQQAAILYRWTIKFSIKM